MSLPLVGLDVIAKEKIRDFIREQNKKGVTFVLTTHDLGVGDLAVSEPPIENVIKELYTERAKPKP
jgi:ABC-type lipoprotein export system ATPase subunit